MNLQEYSKLMVDKINSKVKGWKASTLSFFDKMVLLTLLLAAPPYYLSANIVVPVLSVPNEMEFAMRNFIWQIGDRTRGFVLLVGITYGNFSLYLTFMRKQIGRLVFDVNNFWCKIVRNKFNVGADLWELEVGRT